MHKSHLVLFLFLIDDSCVVSTYSTSAHENLIQFYFLKLPTLAECWITNDLSRAKSSGNSTACVNENFKQCDMSKKLCKPQLCAGVEKTNQIYMVEQGK